MKLSGLLLQGLNQLSPAVRQLPGALGLRGKQGPGPVPRMIISSQKLTCSTSGLDVKVHEAPFQLEELRSFWLQEQLHPNSSLDHFLLICNLRPEVISPCVISVWQNGLCRGLLVGRIERSIIQPRVGYFKFPSCHGRKLAFVHEGLIGRIGAVEAELIIDLVRGYLRAGLMDLATFSSIREESTLLETILATAPVHKPRWATHWELTMAAEPGFLSRAMKSKHRSWVRRKERELEEMYPGRVAWRWYSKIEDITPLCRQMEVVAEHTYQRRLGAGFKDDQEHRERLSLFARQGMLRILLLEVEDRPVAFWFGISYKGVFHSESTGYLGEFQRFEVGTQIFLRLVDELVKERVSRFDFGLGDADYKKRFGDRSWRETTARLFSNNLRGRALRAYVGVCEHLDLALRYVAAQLGIVNRAKQLWRRCLVNRSRS